MIDACDLLHAACVFTGSAVAQRDMTPLGSRLDGARQSSSGGRYSAGYGCAGAPIECTTICLHRRGATEVRRAREDAGGRLTVGLSLARDAILGGWWRPIGATREAGAWRRDQRGR